MRRIDPSRRRYLDIVKGKIKRALHKYLKPDNVIIGPKKGGRKAIKIKFPRIDVKDFFRYDKEKGGVGQGDAQEGEVLGPGDQEPGSGEAGDGTGDHIPIEFDEPEFFKLLQSHLPNIKPKGKSKIPEEVAKFRTVRKMGPESLLLKRRTFKQALKRSIASGEFEPGIVPFPTRRDRRYRGIKMIEEAQFNAVLIFMRDISGSMDEKVRDLISIVCFMTEVWLRGNYKQLETAYLVHDSEAGEVKDQDEFLSISSGGGTKISSVHEALIKVIEKRYNPNLWNIYPIYFSDGDNWGIDDTALCFRMLEKTILPAVNQYSYCQTPSSWGRGEFLNDLKLGFKSNRRVVWTEMEAESEAIRVFQKFFGKKNLGEEKEEIGH